MPTYYVDFGYKKIPILRIKLFGYLSIEQYGKIFKTLLSNF